MMKSTVGIDAISFYTPPCYLDLKDLAKARSIDVDKFYVGLGQEKMAVMPPDQDIVTMGAEAGAKVLKKIDASDIDLLLFATESGIDQSKSAGTYVHRLLNLPSQCRVVELKQACYGATIGLQMALSMLRDYKAKKVLLIASDVARYGLNTTGESSQGGAAVAMVLSASPRILAVERQSGFYTEDVMDFWRPNYREEAFVEGKFSCEQYLKVLQKSWEHYHRVSERSFSDHAAFCYHVPVPRLVEKAHQSLLKFNGLPKLSNEELRVVLGPSLQYGKAIGNCYTAALYLSFVSLLENTAQDLSQQRIGFYSYGSGCVGEFFSGVVQVNYQAMLDKRYHQTLVENRQALSVDTYEDYYRFRYPVDGSSVVLPQTLIEASKRGNPRYRLASLKDHKRIYETAEALVYEAAI